MFFEWDFSKGNLIALRRNGYVAMLDKKTQNRRRSYFCLIKLVKF